jgi:O-acetyl-ADP-ribose deacetylase (regulator of RNase III)
VGRTHAFDGWPRKDSPDAFPAISTGAYAYPLKEATEIAIREVRRFTKKSEVLREVVFCCYSREHLATYKKLME